MPSNSQFPSSNLDFLPLPESCLGNFQFRGILICVYCAAPPLARTEARHSSVAQYSPLRFCYCNLQTFAPSNRPTFLSPKEPNDSEGWYYLGRTKYNENRFAEAIGAFQQCPKLDPKNVKAEDNLGSSFAGLGRNEETTAAYQQAIDWQAQSLTKNPGPYIDLGSLLIDENRPQEAVSFLLQAIEIAPRESRAHELLGKAYTGVEEFPKAQAELEKAIELSPQTPNLHCMLAPVYRKRGLIEKAKA